jgi:hypothetical protein
MRTLLIALAVLLSPFAAQAAEPLGRLFFTPEQRAQLDTLRTRKVVAVQTKDEPPPEIVSYSGIVRRSDGKTTVWVNNQALSEADLREQPAIAGRISRDGKILLGAGKGSMQLKVGQSAELLSGRVAESYTTLQAAPAPAGKSKPEPKPAPASARSNDTAPRDAQPDRGNDTPPASQNPDSRP